MITTIFTHHINNLTSIEALPVIFNNPSFSVMNLDFLLSDTACSDISIILYIITLLYYYIATLFCSIVFSTLKTIQQHCFIYCLKFSLKYTLNCSLKFFYE